MSGGGMDYVKNRLSQLGLEEYAIACVKRSIVPDICFDDEEVCMGEINIQVRPRS